MNQLFAYMQRKLGGIAEFALIYPANRIITNPLALFDFDAGFRLHVVPCDQKYEMLLLLEESSLLIRNAVAA
ncbi:hypothetical protein [Crenobacter intestini]|uniref:Uncharacterized protein n=1 Tax=Crenobacter intestini TaxID=2563443 RepID=A0A4T0UPM3_9NEIS|nr:hypothetical protein [Crenobacter intestini]TIC80285.1 hypothetical protein E5K04_12310 [Crenobacter intestini]